MPFTKTPLDTFLQIQHPGFWLVATVQSTRYQSTDWVWDVEASVQQFYNMLRRE